jgi:hypothetical protein
MNESDYWPATVVFEQKKKSSAGIREMIEREFDYDAETTGRLCQFIVNVHRSFSKNDDLHMAAQLEGVASKIPRDQERL